jgi:hypothetical protein
MSKSTAPCMSLEDALERAWLRDSRRRKYFWCGVVLGAASYMSMFANALVRWTPIVASVTLVMLVVVVHSLGEEVYDLRRYDNRMTYDRTFLQSITWSWRTPPLWKRFLAVACIWAMCVLVTGGIGQPTAVGLFLCVIAALGFAVLVRSAHRGPLHRRLNQVTPRKN